MKWKVTFHQMYIVEAETKEEAMMIAEEKLETDLEQDGVIAGATIDAEIEKIK